MTTDTYKLSSTLKSKGYSTTKVRKLIFTVLDEQEPQTMQQILLKTTPEIDRASVYRTIYLFEKLGIVQRIKIGWKYKLELSDEFHHHHHHLVCLKCDSIISIHESPQLEDGIAEIANVHGFKLVNHQIELQGICAKCLKKLETPASRARVDGKPHTSYHQA